MKRNTLLLLACIISFPIFCIPITYEKQENEIQEIVSKVLSYEDKTQKLENLKKRTIYSELKNEILYKQIELAIEEENYTQAHQYYELVEDTSDKFIRLRIALAARENDTSASLGFLQQLNEPTLEERIDRIIHYHKLDKKEELLAQFKFFKKELSSKEYDYVFFYAFSYFQSVPNYLETFTIDLLPQSKKRDYYLDVLGSYWFHKNEFSKAYPFYKEIQMPTEFQKKIMILSGMRKNKNAFTTSDTLFQTMLNSEALLPYLSFFPEIINFPEPQLLKMEEKLKNYSEDIQGAFYARIGKAYWQEFKQHKAAHYLKKAYKIKPNVYAEHLASFYYLTNQYSKISEVKEITESHPLNFTRNRDFKKIPTKTEIKKIKKHLHDENLRPILDLYLAENFYRNDNLDSAFNAFSELKMENDFVYFRLAQLYYLKKEYGKASEILAKVKKRNWNKEFLSICLSFQENPETFSKEKLPLDKTMSPNQGFVLGQIAFQIGEFELGQSYFKFAEEVPAFRVGLMQFFKAENRDDLAVFYGKKLLPTEDGLLLYQLAESYFNLGDYIEAESYYEEAITHLKDEKLLQNAILGQQKCLRIMNPNSYLSSIEEQLLVTNNAFVKAALMAEKIRIKFEQKKWEEVNSLGRTFIDFFPSHASTEEIKVLAMKAQHNLGTDVLLIEEVLIRFAEEKQSPEILTYWGNIKLAQQDTLSAIQKWKKVYEMTPSSALSDSLLLYEMKINHVDFEADVLAADRNGFHSKVFYQTIHDFALRNRNTQLDLPYYNAIQQLITENTLQNGRMLLETLSEQEKTFFIQFWISYSERLELTEIIEEIKNRYL